MAGAPTSYGYPGSVNSAVLADWLTRVACARFSVGGKDDWKVSVQAGLDRGIRINGGMGVGDSVMDVFPDYDTRSLPLVTSGSRYYLIAARRNWSTPASTNFVVIAGTAAQALPTTGISDSPGQESDQAIALVKVTAGQTVVQEIVDLRAWAGNGGVEAADVLGREPLARPGAQVKVGSSLHCFEYDAANGGSFAWKVYPLGTDVVNLAPPNGWSLGPAGVQVTRTPLIGGKSLFAMSGQLVREDGAFAIGNKPLGLVIPAGYRPKDSLDFHGGINTNDNLYLGSFSLRVTAGGTTVLNSIGGDNFIIEKFGNINFSGNWVA